MEDFPDSTPLRDIAGMFPVNEIPDNAMIEMEANLGKGDQVVAAPFSKIREQLGINGGLAISAVGSTVNVKQGSIPNPLGGVLSFPATSFTMPASSTRYLMLDLLGKIHLFTRSIHSGGVLLATLTSTAGGVVSIVRAVNPSVITSPVARTLAKLQGGQPVSVLIIGDSTSVPAGASNTANGWPSLVFSTAGATSTYRLTNAANVTLTNTSVGGADGLMAMAMVSRIQPDISVADNQNYGLMNLPWKGSFVGVRSSPPGPFIANPPDLAIVCFGANPTTYDAGYIETAVRKLISIGVEVILLTSNHRTDATTIHDDATIALRTAITHGAAIADSFAFIEELNAAGPSTYADQVHQNNLGQAGYAAAIRSVLPDLLLPKSHVRSAEPTPRVHLPPTTDNNYRKGFPNASFIQFTPNGGTGTAVATALPSYSLPVVLGGKSSATAITQLTSSGTPQYAQFSHSMPLRIDGYFENTLACTIQIRTNNDSTLIKTINIPASPNPMQRVTLLTHAEIYAIATSTFGYAWPQARPLSYRITCTSGTALLAAVQTLSFEMKEVPWGRVQWSDETANINETVTTWLAQAPPVGTGVWKYTDTTGAKAFFDFEGCGLLAVLGSYSSSGKINVYVDGEQLASAQDIWSNSGTHLVFAGTYFPGNQSGANKLSGNYKPDHIARLAIDAAFNAGQIAVTASSHRLAIYDIIGFDCR